MSIKKYNIDDRLADSPPSTSCPALVATTCLHKGKSVTLSIMHWIYDFCLSMLNWTERESEINKHTNTWPKIDSE